jgi:bacteriocin biosynthesis cyclodehydratase domain-containing protein
MLDRLLAERLVIDEPTSPTARAHRIHVVGDGPVADRVRAASPATAPEDAAELRVIVQETLELGRALALDRAALEDGAARLWVSTGPLARAFVGPVFLADGGPCLGCLVAAFRRVSPEPEIFEALADHEARAGSFARAPIDDDAADTIAALVRWKARELGTLAPAAAVFRLHVLERASFEISTHLVPVDPDCPAPHEAA